MIPKHVEKLHTFPILEELKVSVNFKLLKKDIWTVFQNFSKITKLEVEIDSRYGCGYEIDDDDLVPFLHLFPNLVSLALKSDGGIAICNVSHPNINLLTFKKLGVDCPNLKRLILPEMDGAFLHMKAKKNCTEVESVGKLRGVEVGMKYEVEKEFFESSFDNTYSRRLTSADILMQFKYLKSLSIDARDLIYLYKSFQKLEFPVIPEYEESIFNLSRHVPIEFIKWLSNSPSFKEMYFTSTDRLYEKEIEVFKSRYKKMTNLYPNFAFSSPWDI